jgi:hypothetical protein
MRMFSCSNPVGIVGVVTPCVKVDWPGVGTEVETVSLPYNTSHIRLDTASSICYNNTRLSVHPLTAITEFIPTAYVSTGLANKCLVGSLVILRQCMSC